MSKTLLLIAPGEGDRQYLLASGSGWTNAERELLRLKPGLADHLRRFVKKGKIKDTLRLANEVGKSLDVGRFSDAVRDVLGHLHEHLGVGDSDETAYVIE